MAAFASSLDASPRHDFEKGTSIGRVGLVLRTGPVQNVGARSGRALLINKRACKNIQVFVVFMVFNDTHPVSRVHWTSIVN
jgi:hypothetical protein